MEKVVADKNAFEKLLDKSGLKRKVIAERLDISRSALYKKQKNPRNIGADEMAEFADVLGVDPKTVLNAILISQAVDKNNTTERKKVKRTKKAPTDCNPSKALV